MTKKNFFKRKKNPETRKSTRSAEFLKKESILSQLCGGASYRWKDLYGLSYVEMKIIRKKMLLVRFARSSELRPHR